MKTLLEPLTSWASPTSEQPWTVLSIIEDFIANVAQQGYHGSSRNQDGATWCLMAQHGASRPSPKPNGATCCQLTITSWPLPIDHHQLTITSWPWLEKNGITCAQVAPFHSQFLQTSSRRSSPLALNLFLCQMIHSLLRWYVPLLLAPWTPSAPLSSKLLHCNSKCSMLDKTSYPNICVMFAIMERRNITYRSRVEELGALLRVWWKDAPIDNDSLDNIIGVNSIQKKKSQQKERCHGSRAF